MRREWCKICLLRCDAISLSEILSFFGGSGVPGRYRFRCICQPQRAPRRCSGSSRRRCARFRCARPGGPLLQRSTSTSLRRWGGAQRTSKPFSTTCSKDLQNETITIQENMSITSKICFLLKCFLLFFLKVRYTKHKP